MDGEEKSQQASDIHPITALDRALTVLAQAGLQVGGAPVTSDTIDKAVRGLLGQVAVKNATIDELLQRVPK